MRALLITLTVISVTLTVAAAGVFLAMNLDDQESNENREEEVVPTPG